MITPADEGMGRRANVGMIADPETGKNVDIASRGRSAMRVRQDYCRNALVDVLEGKLVALASVVKHALTGWSQVVAILTYL